MHSITHLNFIDWVIIAIYFMFVLGIGFYVKAGTKTSQDFFLAGRRNSSWIAGLAFLSANMGALELIGMAGQSYQYGFLVGHFYLIGAIPAMLFLAIYMMPFYYSKKIQSIPGYLKLRYNEATRTLNALMFAVMTLLMAGINMYAMALVLHVFVGWGFHSSIWMSSITVAAYVALGGLESAIYSEVLQFFLIWFGLFLAVILGVIHVGGYHQIIERLPPTFGHLWSTTGHASGNPMLIDWFGIVFGLGFVLSFGYWTTDFLVIQRAFSAKDMRSARMTPIVASFFKMAVPFMVVGAGLLALVLVKTHRIVSPDRPDDALLYLLNSEYTHGLLGLGVTALLAGFMSGQAGNISAFNTVFTYDLYKAHWVKDKQDRHYVAVGRWVTVMGILLSVMTAYWAMSMPSIMDYMQALFSMVNAPLFGIIVMGMFWKRINAHGAFWGLLIGMGVAVTLFFTHSFEANTSPMAANFWRAIWAWVSTVSATTMISLMTQPQPVSQIKELVYGLSPIPKDETLLWYQRPKSWAWISLGVFVVLNIVFW